MEDEELNEHPGSGTTGFVIAASEADGGLLLEMNAPKEGLQKRAVVAGRLDSLNTKKAVVRKVRRMVRDWADAVFGDPSE